MTVSPLESFSTAVADLVERAAPTLASVSGHRRHTASAFHWRDGLYVTADEAVEADESPTLTFASGTSSSAEVIGRDPSTGIALLKPANAPAAPVFTPSDPLRAGQLIVAVGRSDASVLSALGSVSLAGPAWRSMRGGVIDHRIELSVSAGWRFEGGAALDAGGRLAGLVLFGPRRRALVIPTETIARVATTLAEKGFVARGYLGAGLHPLRHSGQKGAIILSIDEGGPAGTAGLHVGDVVSTWNGEEVEGIRDIMRRLGPDSVGQTISLGIIRAGVVQAVAITVGARPHR